MLVPVNVLPPPPPPPTPAPASSPPLGPFPRYIWIHQDTPQDGLDKACHEIWKRVQDLQEAFRTKAHEEVSPRQSAPAHAPAPAPPPTPVVDPSVARTSSRSHFIEGSMEELYGNDEIARLVKQEYLSLMREILNETGSNGQQRQGVKAPPPELNLPPIMMTSSLPCVNRCTEPNTSVADALKSILGSKEKETKIRSDSDSLLSSKPIVPPTFHPVTSSSSGLSGESVTGSTAASNKEINYLLAQFQLNQIDMRKAPDNEILMEEARIIKDFLKNSMFNSANSKDAAMSPPSAPERSGEGQNSSHSKQLPVFVKIRSKPESNEDDRHNRDKNKYGSYIFPPRTAGSSSNTNRPFLLNYHPLPLLANHPNFAHYQQGLFQQRTRVPFPQNMHPQMGGFSRQMHPFNQASLAQQLMRSGYPPLMGYIPFIPPDYSSFQQRNSAKSMSSTRDPTPMAGDGPQFLFQHPFGFNAPPSAPVIGNPFFSSAGNGFASDGFFLGQR